MVLLVVDTQKGIVDERLYAFEKFVSNIKELIRTAREQGIEVIYVQHDDGPGTGFSIGDDEFDIYSEFAPLQTEKRFVKTVCNAFKKESGLLEYLTAKGFFACGNHGIQRATTRNLMEGCFYEIFCLQFVSQWHSWRRSVPR